MSRHSFMVFKIVSFVSQPILSSIFVVGMALFFEIRPEDGKRYIYDYRRICEKPVLRYDKTIEEMLAEVDRIQPGEANEDMTLSEIEAERQDVLRLAEKRREEQDELSELWETCAMTFEEQNQRKRFDEEFQKKRNEEQRRRKHEDHLAKRRKRSDHSLNFRFLSACFGQKVIICCIIY